MAISNDNYVIQGLSGTVGKLLTFRQRGQKTVVQKYRRTTNIPPTEKLKSVRASFASCIAYAKTVVKNPAVKAIYQAAAKDGQTAFNVATSDALNPPELTSINTSGYLGLPGDTIEIQATDDFKVAEVVVSIHGPTGELLEQGNAVQDPNTGDWLFKATKENSKLTGSTITASAKDLPGNNGSLSVIMY